MIKEQEKTQQIMAMFAPIEGVITCYYGKVRNGKTYSATADILDLLNRGEVVFANWEVQWQGYDQRKNKLLVFLKMLTGQNYFFQYKKDNFHYFSPELSPQETVRLLNKLVGVHIFIDEGQWVLNSHVRNPDIEAQKLILTNGHYCRSLNIITQRPSNVFVDMRSQVNIWHKCVKVWLKPLRFVRYDIEDMKDNLPDENEEKMQKYPRKAYWARKKVYMAYNTHVFRSQDAKLEVSSFKVYNVPLLDKIKLLVGMSA